MDSRERNEGPREAGQAPPTPASLGPSFRSREHGGSCHRSPLWRAPPVPAAPAPPPLGSLRCRAVLGVRALLGRTPVLRLLGRHPSPILRRHQHVAEALDL